MKRLRLKSWLSRLQEDFKSGVPEYNDLEVFRSEMMARLEETFESNDEADSFFDEKEKHDLLLSLERMQEKIDELYQEKNATRSQMRQMQLQLNKIKESVEILDKRTWLSASMNRVINIYKEVKAAKNEVTVLLSDFDKMLPSPENINEELEG